MSTKPPSENSESRPRADDALLHGQHQIVCPPESPLRFVVCDPMVSLGSPPWGVPAGYWESVEAAIRADA